MREIFFSKYSLDAFKRLISNPIEFMLVSPESIVLQCEDFFYDCTLKPIDLENPFKDTFIVVLEVTTMNGRCSEPPDAFKVVMNKTPTKIFLAKTVVYFEYLPPQSLADQFPMILEILWNSFCLFITTRNPHDYLEYEFEELRWRRKPHRLQMQANPDAFTSQKPLDGYSYSFDAGFVLEFGSKNVCLFSLFNRYNYFLWGENQFLTNSELQFAISYYKLINLATL